MRPSTIKNKHSCFYFHHITVSPRPAKEAKSQRRAVIFIFCLIFLFSLYSTAKPVPAPAHKPEIAQPKGISPPAYSLVISIDTEQFGTKPTKAQIKGEKALPPKEASCDKSAYCKAKFRPKFTIKIKKPVLRLRLSEDRKIFAPPALQAQEVLCI